MFYTIHRPYCVIIGHVIPEGFPLKFDRAVKITRPFAINGTCIFHFHVIVLRADQMNNFSQVDINTLFVFRKLRDNSPLN